MGLPWTIVATTMLVASSFATFVTMLHLRWRWDLYASSVRWLFWFLFACKWAWCSLRSIFFVWRSCQTSMNVTSDPVDVDVHYTSSQLDRLGIHGVVYLHDAKKPWITTVLCLGDIALVGIGLTLFLLTYELWRLARTSMDRGRVKEKAQIRRYATFIGCCMILYAIAQLVLALVFHGYNIYLHRCLLGVYVLQFFALAYMANRLFMLKVNGRKFETIQGTFVTSPVYQRLKRIVFIYAVFVFQFQVSTLVISLHKRPPNNATIDFVGVSLIIYNLSGVALAITTSCSQACILSACARCLPDDFEAEFNCQRIAAPSDEDLEAPQENPVFVFTDIQSSTALWSKDSTAMATASDIHDTILRSSLLKHRGYEITTVGDAFQVAFRTIRDAVEYCMDVQLQLLLAKWPKEIHGLIPSTGTQRVGRRVIFNGLRVRMGIHDASQDDGQLVKGVHAVTGKTTYTGVSALVAEYVGDLGSGGQILLTERIATWLKHHREDLSIDIFLEYIGGYSVPQVQTQVEIYQLQPAMLADRVNFFKKPAQEPTTASSTPSEDTQRLHPIPEESPKVDNADMRYQVHETPREIQSKKSGSLHIPS